jgi:hypothetical protein
MTDLHANLPEVDALLAERDALHAWLTRLDAAPVSAPNAVRDRVRADYQQRLDGVTEALRQHADTLAERLAADRSERAELDRQASTSREALAEAELRHAVGEYDAARFEAERVRHTSDLETFELSLAAVDERIDRLEGIAASVSSTPAPVAPMASAAPAQETVEEASAVPIEALAPAAEPEPADPEMSDPGASSGDPDADEREDDAPDPDVAQDDTLDSDALLAVFGIDGTPKPFVPEPPPSDAAPLSFTPSGATPATPPLGMPMAEPPRFSPPARPAVPPPPVEPDVTPMFAAGMVPEPHDDRDGPAEPEVVDAVARTVRCGECGAMNRPLEWYCEKCGAELTAM